MEIRNLKVGDWFEKPDGGICRVELLNDCRARIYVSNVKRKRQVDLWGKTEESESSAYRNVSPGTEVVRVLNEEDLQKQPKAEGRGEEDFMKKGKKENNLSACAVIRWMGVDDFSLNEVKAGLVAMKFAKLPNDNTIRRQLHIGRTKEEGRGDPAQLTSEQQKELRAAAKTVKTDEETDETKKAAPKKTKKASKKNGTKSRDKKSTGLPFSKDRQLGKKTEERIGK